MSDDCNNTMILASEVACLQRASHLREAATAVSAALYVVAFRKIALATKKLDVGLGVSSALGHGNYVVELQIGICAAFGAAAAISLPHALPHLA